MERGEVKKLILKKEKLLDYKDKENRLWYDMDNDEFIEVSKDEIHDELRDYCFENIEHKTNECDRIISEDVQKNLNQKIHKFVCKSCCEFFSYFETHVYHIDSEEVITWEIYYETEDRDEDYEYKLYNNYIKDEDANKVFYTVFKSKERIEINII